MTPDDAMEDIESFRERTHTWLKHNVPLTEVFRSFDDGPSASDKQVLADVEHDRELQRTLYEGGLAGICVPREYGGQGLTPDHQRVLNEELLGFEYPARLQVPTFTPCVPVLLEFGTEEQKRTHLPAILKGENIWVQFLSEPDAGSDVAAAQTSAVRDGDEWRLSGSKIWTSGAWWSDWALCLARTNWDVPKHRGLSVFILPLDSKGIEINRIEMVNGSKEFCQEFMSDVLIPDSDRIGSVDDGWTIGTRWMSYERNVGGSAFITRPAGTTGSSVWGTNGEIFEVARRVAKLEESHSRELVGEARALGLVLDKLTSRISSEIAAGSLSYESAAILRLMRASVRSRLTTIGFELAGPQAIAWSRDDVDLGERGLNYLARQAGSIGGGTTEISRNVISERILGMPREPGADRGIPFREVLRTRESDR
jgi:alkylation response protein AidB-like acyl-CoA dehydrogenase